jgi:clan AA aspartic protease (TIGR02281 family)
MPAKRFSVLVCLASVLAFLSVQRTRAADYADALKNAGLSKSGEVYLLADETTAIAKMKDLRTTKVQADKESKARKVLEFQIAAKKKILKDNDKEWHDLESRLSVITDVGIHNRVVTRMNRLVVEQKQAMSDEKDLEEQAQKQSITAKTQFVDDMATLAPIMDAVAAKYKTLAADTAINAAIAKARSSTGDTKIALGPSLQFVTDQADLKKWQSEIESEAIPIRDEHGIHIVDVLLNGEHFLMGIDTGAAYMSLSGDAADKLNIALDDKAPVVHLQLADGHIAEGRIVSLKSVRVGRFTVEEVPCVVMDKSLTDAPLLLGGSFLNHFIVKLDPAAGELRLTQIKSEGGAKVNPLSASDKTGTGDKASTTK